MHLPIKGKKRIQFFGDEKGATKGDDKKHASSLIVFTSACVVAGK